MSVFYETRHGRWRHTRRYIAWRFSDPRAGRGDLQAREGSGCLCTVGEKSTKMGEPGGLRSATFLRRSIHLIPSGYGPVQRREAETGQTSLRSLLLCVESKPANHGIHVGDTVQYPQPSAKQYVRNYYQRPSSTNCTSIALSVTGKRSPPRS